jgi:hypothetical protein
MTNANPASLEYPDLLFNIVGQRIKIHCHDDLFRKVIQANFDAFHDFEGPADLEYTVTRPVSGGFTISRDNVMLAEAQNDDAILYSSLYWLEKAITLDLQDNRTDLYFVHASVLEHQGHVIMIAAESGTGKSTTAWALLQHGFRYLSDELAPIDPTTLAVHAYPHALCLKAVPPGPYPLPQNVIQTERTIHIPAGEISNPVIRHPAPLKALFFLQREPNASRPTFSKLSAAEAGTRLYANTLNALAHPGSGLDTAIGIASAVPAFLLNAGELRPTCELILNIVDDMPGA